MTLAVEIKKNTREDLSKELKGETWQACSRLLSSECIHEEHN